MVKASHKKGDFIILTTRGGTNIPSKRDVQNTVLLRGFLEITQLSQKNIKHHIIHLSTLFTKLNLIWAANNPIIYYIPIDTCFILTRKFLDNFHSLSVVKLLQKYDTYPKPTGKNNTLWRPNIWRDLIQKGCWSCARCRSRSWCRLLGSKKSRIFYPFEKYAQVKLDHFCLGKGVKPKTIFERTI